LNRHEHFFIGFADSLRSELFRRVRGKRLLLPEGSDIRVVEAGRSLRDLFGIEVVVGSDRDALARLADNRIVVEQMFEKRNKPAPANVEEICCDVLVAAGCQLSRGEVDGVVAGSVAETAKVIRAILLTVGLGEGVSTLCSAFLMNLKEPTPGGQNPLVFADAGVVPDPSSDQLVEIGFLAARAHASWVSGRQQMLSQMLSQMSTQVAFLSFSTSGSASHPSVTKVANAARRFAEIHPEILSQGELQLDAAIVPDVAMRKIKGAGVGAAGARPGGSNVLVFPNLDSGNITYKAVERLGNAAAWGPIVLGAARPYSDLSRGCSALDIVHVAVLTLALC
jgi:phosphate acetyltransferase